MATAAQKIACFIRVEKWGPGHRREVAFAASFPGVRAPNALKKDALEKEPLGKAQSRALLRSESLRLVSTCYLAYVVLPFPTFPKGGASRLYFDSKAPLRIVDLHWIFPRQIHFPPAL